MPTRSPQHQLETLSRNRFKSLIPQRWVCRDKGDDYGIDQEVEIFDDRNKTTGLVFWVQLKATGSIEDSEIFGVDLKIDSLEYYRSLEIPVLLARYSKRHDAVYVKWVNNVDLSFAKTGQKTFRIKLSSDDIFRDPVASQIESRVRRVREIKRQPLSLPIPIYISFEANRINGHSVPLVEVRIRKMISSHRDLIELKNEEQDSYVQVTLKNNELEVSLCGLTGVTFHHVNERKDDNFIDLLAQDILLGVGLCSSAKVYTGLLSRFIFEMKLESRLIQRPEFLSNWLFPLIEGPDFKKVVDLAERVCTKANEPQYDAILQIAISKFVYSGDEQRRGAYRAYLQDKIDRSPFPRTDPELGATHYSLANFYSNSSEYRLAIGHYSAARKCSSGYMKQHYFLSEIAGILFITKRFKRSARFYKLALENGAALSKRALLADALMFSGSYEDSIGEFHSYLEEASDPPAEFRLKYQCLKDLQESFEIGQQERQPAKASALADVSSLPLELQESALLEALNFDLLSSLAWFNLGHFNEVLSNHVSASFCFTMAGLIGGGDMDAWVCAALHAVYRESDGSYFILVVSAGFELLGEGFVERFLEKLTIKEEQLILVSQSLNEILQPLREKKTTKNKVIHRIFDGENPSLDISQVLENPRNGTT